MVEKIIANRRAIYPNQFSSEEISKKEIELLLEAANWAPTHKRTEPWRFKVFHSLSSRNALSDFLVETYKNTASHYSEIKSRKISEKPLQSGCVIAICYLRDPNLTLPEWEEVASTAMAVQNMWLLAGEMKLGGYWSSPGMMNYLGNHVPLQPQEKCIGFFYLGRYSDPVPAGSRKTSGKEKTSWH